MTRFHTTVTERGAFRNCRRSWYFDNVLRLRQKGHVTWYLIYGDVMHSSLDAYYRPKTSRSHKPPRDVGLALDAFDEAWGKENDKLKADYGPLYSMGIEEEWYKYRDTGKQTLIYYDRFDKQDPFFNKVIDIGVEDRSFIEILGQRFGSSVDEEPPLLSGRIDLVVERPDGIWIVDHKNLSSKASDRALDVDDQITGYCYIWYRLSGKPPKGAYYNVLLKDPPKPPRLIYNDTKLSQDKDQRTTYDLYKEAIKENGFSSADYAEFLTFLKEKGWTQFFQRLGPVTRNVDELESFEERLYHEYLEMDRALRHEEWRYPNPSQYTCPGCPIMPICQAMEEKSDIDWIIESSFEKIDPRHQIPEGV